LIAMHDGAAQRQFMRVEQNRSSVLLD
jgi:hypothetical protein